ncbi:hypothetical protein BC826DRAFT_1137341 [Russula brevipes]|nr:hypothetical protein BC826DRAFT_1137341 [Russula brevipes]
MPVGHLKTLLLPLKESITDTLPFVSGTLKLPATHFSLFYKIAREAHAARFEGTCASEERLLANLQSQRHVNFTSATSDELEQLAQACQPATFGRNDETVMDETYRKTEKIDPDLFSTPLGYDHTDIVKIVRDLLLNGTDSLRKLKVELYKLNFYGKGAFFKPHVDTPRGEKMFGSLVLVFPTPHEGGALLARHRGTEWMFDSAAELLAAPPSSIGYAAFLSDVEHEVAPVRSGHRITLTYNLYFDDDGFDDDGLASVSEPLTAPSLQTEIERNICAAFEALLENTLFLPDGGILGFGLRHVYQFKEDIGHVYDLFKGSDAALYRAVRSLGFKAVLYLYYEHRQDAGLIECPPDFDCGEFGSQVDLLHDQGGIAIRLRGKDVRPADWVTPVTTFNCLSSTYLALGNEAQ